MKPNRCRYSVSNISIQNENNIKSRKPIKSMPISFDWLSAFVMALFSNGVALGEEKANDSNWQVDIAFF